MLALNVGRLQIAVVAADRVPATLDNSPFRSHILSTRDSRDESQLSELSGECGFMRSANVACI